MTTERREVYTKLHNKYGIPQHEIEAIASCILPKIQEFFASEEGRKEFEEWKQKQKKEME